MGLLSIGLFYFCHSTFDKNQTESLERQKQNLSKIIILEFKSITKQRFYQVLFSGICPREGWLGSNKKLFRHKDERVSVLVFLSSNLIGQRFKPITFFRRFKPGFVYGCLDGRGHRFSPRTSFKEFLPDILRNGKIYFYFRSPVSPRVIKFSIDPKFFTFSYFQKRGCASFAENFWPIIYCLAFRLGFLLVWV